VKVQTPPRGQRGESSLRVPQRSPRLVHEPRQFPRPLRGGLMRVQDPTNLFGFGRVAAKIFHALTTAMPKAEFVERAVSASLGSYKPLATQGGQCLRRQSQCGQGRGHGRGVVGGGKRSLCGA